MQVIATKSILIIQEPICCMGINFLHGRISLLTLLVMMSSVLTNYVSVISIPMGTDCAPLVADLFLFSFEFEFMKIQINNDLPLARKFNRTFRYVFTYLKQPWLLYLHRSNLPKRTQVKKNYRG